jgi:hypothetical protein
MNAVEILFRSGRFNLSKVGEHFIIPCFFGEDLAAWLQPKLSAKDIETAKPYQEDWGWELPAQYGPHSYYLCMSGNADDPGNDEGEWHIIVEKRQSICASVRAAWRGGRTGCATAADFVPCAASTRAPRDLFYQRALGRFVSESIDPPAGAFISGTEGTSAEGWKKWSRWSGIGLSYPAMLSPGRVSLSHAVHWLVAAVLLLLGVLAVLQPSRYILLFTSKSVLLFVWCSGIVLLYFLLREDRA